MRQRRRDEPSCGRCRSCQRLPARRLRKRGMRKRGTSTRSVSRWRSRRGCRCTSCAASNGTCCTILSPRNPTRSARPAAEPARASSDRALPRAVLQVALTAGDAVTVFADVATPGAFRRDASLPAPCVPPRPSFRHALTLLALVRQMGGSSSAPRAWAPASLRVHSSYRFSPAGLKRS